uniref:Uncharacterized protein n=1 Tax=Toxoplasma gondii TgCATBr9 TaxID=943120 RepID=A0A2T6IJJ5_TOXGO|nr:hypothetical protein TGBR9_384060 [Toxoplasma gondii TgCATBr9]
MAACSIESQRTENCLQITHDIQVISVPMCPVENKHGHLLELLPPRPLVVLHLCRGDAERSRTGLLSSRKTHPGGDLMLYDADTCIHRFRSRILGSVNVLPHGSGWRQTEHQIS